MPTTAAVRDLARQIWPLDWQIDLGAAEPPVVTAEAGPLTVAIALTAPLTVVGSLADQDFFEAETDDLRAALTELEHTFRRMVDIPRLA